MRPGTGHAARRVGGHGHAGARVRARRGFTILELVMVVMLLGLVAAGVTAGWEAMVPRAQLNGEVRTLAATLQKARSEAIGRKAEFWVEYDLDEDAYRVLTPFRIGGGLLFEGEDEVNRIILDRHRLVDGVEIASVYIDGVESTQGKALVRFDPLGAASDHAVVLVQPLYENFYTIEVLALTGLIRFHEGLFTREPPQDGDFR